MSLDLVSRNGTYLSASGRRFLCLGAHWVPASGLHWPVTWQPDEIRRDFEVLKGLGSNTVRIDLFWNQFEPLPGFYDPAALQQLDAIVDIARELELYLHPVLFIGGETGYYDVPWRHGRHPHADPDMLRLQTDHAAALVRRYRDEPVILAWDLTDEPPFWIARGSNTTDAMGVNWTRLIAGAVRRESPLHLLCVGTDQEDLRHGPFRPDLIVDEVDFLSVHPYPIYQPELFPDPMLSVRTTYAAAFQTALSSAAGKPVMVHELGSSAAQYDPELIAAYDRTQIWSSFGAGANGFLLWDATDAAPATWQQAPYRLAPHETQFGLTTWDRRDRPAGRDIRAIFAALGGLDLEGIEPEPADAAILVPWEWAKPEGDQRNYATAAAPGPYVAHHQGSVVTGVRPFDWHESNQWLVGSWLSTFICLRQAGLKPDFPREHGDWRGASTLYLPSPLTSTGTNLVHPHTVFWDEVGQWVEAGGSLYASVCGDAAIPEMSAIFGARLADHMPVREVTLEVVSAHGGLEIGTRFTYTANPADRRHWAATLLVGEGTVVAVDQDGRPALVANTRGQGRTLLSAYPVETYLAATPNAFESGDESWRVHRAASAGTPRFIAGDPLVEVSVLAGSGRGYVVLTNHSGAARTVRLSPGRSGGPYRVTAADGQALGQEAGHWSVEVPAWNGRLLAWNESAGGR